MVEIKQLHNDFGDIVKYPNLIESILFCESIGYIITTNHKTKKGNRYNFFFLDDNKNLKLKINSLEELYKLTPSQDSGLDDKYYLKKDYGHKEFLYYKRNIDNKEYIFLNIYDKIEGSYLRIPFLVDKEM